MRLIKIAKEKLSEKNIHWEEVYTDKTMYLKNQFEDIIGAGSYFRFEGSDNETGSEYYVIIGPAKIRQPRAKFFAGVRKLPATYPAGGKYFDSMDSAANYAKETWGINIPSTLKPYTSAHLFNIAKKVDMWKKKKKREEERQKDREIEKEE